jgi:hypothetical protein
MLYRLDYKWLYRAMRAYYSGYLGEYDYVCLRFNALMTYGDAFVQNVEKSFYDCEAWQTQAD